MPTKMVKNTLVEHATKTLLGAKGQIIKSAAQAETARAEAASSKSNLTKSSSYPVRTKNSPINLSAT